VVWNNVTQAFSKWAEAESRLVWFFSIANSVKCCTYIAVDPATLQALEDTCEEMQQIVSDTKKYVSSVQHEGKSLAELFDKK